MEFVADGRGRLDVFLAAHGGGLSRTKLQRLIRAGAFKVNGRSVTKPGFVVRHGDRIEARVEKLFPSAKSFVTASEPDIPLEVVYEDKDIAVINKPAGLLTHPTSSQPRHTLANALVARYPEMMSVGENQLRPGIVHRLDKDTSGLLVAAKNQAAFLWMKKQFMERRVRKRYLALVEGVPREKKGVITYAIRPSKQNRLKKVAIKKVIRHESWGMEQTTRAARVAHTFYRVRKIIGGKCAIVECEPTTGRTHQIRVHLAAIGHPVAGDWVYGSRAKTPRQFLHAYYLGFTAPSGIPLALEVGLPRDLEQILHHYATKLRSKAPTI